MGIWHRALQISGLPAPNESVGVSSEYKGVRDHARGLAIRRQSLLSAKVSAADVPIDEAQELAVHDDSAHVESSLDLKRLLAELTPKARQSIQYVKLDGLSVSEAAARSGMSESAVKVSVHRGLKALGRLIREAKPS